MNTSRINLETFLIGQGRQLYELLTALSYRSRFLDLQIQAVADLEPDPDFPITELTRQIGIETVAYSLQPLLEMPAPELVIVTAADQDILGTLRAHLPATTTIIGPPASKMVTAISRLLLENRSLREDSRRLKETRLRFNQFVDTASLAIYFKDRDLRYRRINKHALHVLGLSENEVVGKSDWAVFPGSSARWLQKVEQETLRSRQTLHATGVLPVQGQDMHVQVTLFPLIENDVVTGLYGLIEDTTELIEKDRKLLQVDEQLDETQKYLREVLAHSRDMIFLTDPEGKLLSFNSGAEHVLGFKRDEVVGTPAQSLAESPEAFAKLFRAVLRDGHTTQYEMEFRKKNQEKAICNISLTLIDGPDGLPLEVVGICRDITTRLRLKDDLIRSERLAAVGQMAAGVAHEINNPLAVIDTIAGVVEETLEDEGQAMSDGAKDLLGNAIVRLRAQVQRVTNITHSLLGFVRKSEAGMMRVSLHEIVDECLNVLAVELRRGNVEVSRQYSADAEFLVSDPTMLQQVFVNLISNAIDAVAAVADRKHQIEVKTVMDGKRILVMIQDNGVGIAFEDQEKIFNLFHTTKPVGVGTGLGLSIVHDILYRLGGNIRVASVPGQWSRFTVELPLEPPQGPLPDPSSVDI